MRRVCDIHKVLPPPEGRVAENPPEGITVVYPHSLRAGMELPLRPFQNCCVKAWGCLPWTLMPVAWILMNAYERTCSLMDVEPSVGEFGTLHRITRLPSRAWDVRPASGTEWAGYAKDDLHWNAFFFARLNAGEWDFPTIFDPARAPPAFPTDSLTPAAQEKVAFGRSLADQHRWRGHIAAVQFCGEAQMGRLTRGEREPLLDILAIEPQFKKAHHRAI